MKKLAFFIVIGLIPCSNTVCMAAKQPDEMNCRPANEKSHVKQDSGVWGKSKSAKAKVSVTAAHEGLCVDGTMSPLTNRKKR